MLGRAHLLSAALVLSLWCGAGAAHAEGTEVEFGLLPATEHLAADDELLVELRLGQHLVERVFFIWVEGEQVLLPLDAFRQALRLAWEVRPAAGAMQGWLVHQDRPIVLDLAAATLTVEGRVVALPPGATRRTDDEIYLDAAVLSAATVLDIALHWATLTLRVRSAEPLPSELEIERLRRWSGWRPPAEAENLAHLPGVDDLPAWWSAPALDVEVRSGRSSAGAWAEESSFAVRAAGDLGRQSFMLFSQGTGETGVDDVRAHLGRQSASGDLLGRAYATEYQLGDIRLPGSAAIRRSRFGRGITLSNEPLGVRRSFDRQAYSGETSPGWAVELYRNDVLVAFTADTADGQYLFDNVETEVGRNLWRVVEYGPLGEVRETTRLVQVSPSLVPPGSVQYRFAAGQREPEPVRVVRRAEALPPDQDGWGEAGAGTDELASDILRGFDGFAQVRYGLGARVSVFGELATLARVDDEGAYAQLGTDFVVAGWAARVALSQDDTGGRSYLGDLQTDWRGFSLRGRLDVYDDFMGETFEAGSVPAWRAQGELAGLALGRAAIRLGYRYEAYGDELVDRDALDVRLSGNTRRVAWTNTVSFNNLASEGHASAGQGRLTLRSRSLGGWAGLVPSMDLGYQLGDGDTRLNGARVAASWRQGPHWRGRAEIGGTLSGAGSTSAGLGASREGAAAVLGGSVRWTSDGAWAAFASVNVGFGRNPHCDCYQPVRYGTAEQGSATVKVVFDDGSGQPVPLDDVRIRVGRRPAGWTDGSGIVQLPPMQAGQPVAVGIMEGSLADPFWIADDPAVRVTARPGVIHPVQVVVRPSGEVDGVVSTVIRGQDRFVPGLRLLLLTAEDAQVVAQATTAYDGFFVFDRVRPGRYLVQPDPDQLLALGYATPPARGVEVAPQGNMVGGVDFHLEAAQH